LPEQTLDESELLYQPVGTILEQLTTPETIGGTVTPVVGLNFIERLAWKPAL
jgi:hypothetical protein